MDSEDKFQLSMFGLLFVFALIFIPLLAVLSPNRGVDDLKQQAIAVGVAEYVVDETGKV